MVFKTNILSKPLGEAAMLKKQLAQERKARKHAEKRLEECSTEFDIALSHLKEANGRMESLLAKEGKSLEAAFVNLVDPFVIMDLSTKIISMNTSAKEFLGYDNDKEEVILYNLVHEDYAAYTSKQFDKLMRLGLLKNYNAKIITKNFGEKYVNINANLIYNNQGTPVAAQGIIRDITAEMEVKRLVESQKSQLDVIVENSTIGILVLEDNTIIKANKAICDMLGHGQEELKKGTLDDFLALEGISHFKSLLDPNETGGQIKVTRKYKKHPSGFFYGKTSVKRLYQSLGGRPYKMVMIEDVTKEKLANDRLKLSEERMATMIGSLRSGVLFEDNERRLVMANLRVMELFSIPKSIKELKGVGEKKVLQEYKHFFADPEAYATTTEAMVKNGQVALGQEYELKDGRIFSRDYIPLFDEDQCTGHLWVYNDITLPKKYRNKLERQKEKYSSIIANMNLGLVEIDGNGDIQFANHRYRDMVGMSTKELNGTHILQGMGVDNENQSVFEEQQLVLNSGESVSYQLEVFSGNPDKTFWMVSGAPTYDESGNISGSIYVYLDISEQRNLQLHKEYLLKELEESNKGLQEYAHIVSHDLKSPLRSVSALIDWLCQDYEDKLDENGMFNLKMIQEKIEGMDRLIGGILKYSTLSSNRIENVAVDLNRIIDKIREIIFIPRNVIIKTVRKLPIIKADKTMMHQLFQNFLGNAVIHIDKPKGIVEVDFEDMGTHWQFSIKDNGVGIPQEYHQKIFQIFQSIGNKDKSSGIGLSIVKKIIERYKGKVWLQSEIDEGTTFFFTLIKL